jgi:hypothetical protein
VDNIHILPTILKGLVQNAVNCPQELRYGLIKSCFAEIRLFNSPNIRNIELLDIQSIEKAKITGGSPQERLDLYLSRLYCLL